MLRVTIEVVPFGHEGSARVLDTLYVGNMEQREDHSSYHAWFNDDPRGIRDRRPPDAVVVSHKRSDGYRPLLAEVFRLAGSDEA